MNSDNKDKRPTPTPDTPDVSIDEGRESINSADGNSQENVISSTSKKKQDDRHSRKHGEPITGANPKSV